MRDLKSSQADRSELKLLWEPVSSGRGEPGGDVLAYIRDTSVDCFSSDGLCIPPFAVPILIWRRADFSLQKVW